MIGGLLRKPPGGRKQRAQLALEEGIDRDVCGADRIIGRFFPHLQRMAMSRPGGQGNRASIADDLFEAGAIDHCVWRLVPFRLGAQGEAGV